MTTIDHPTDARVDYRHYLDAGGKADWATWWERYRGDYATEAGGDREHETCSTSHPMTAWLVALVSPEGDVEAWLTADRQVTPAHWDAVRFASREEADAVAVAQNDHDRRLPHRDGRRWVAQAEVVEVVA